MKYLSLALVLFVTLALTSCSRTNTEVLSTTTASTSAAGYAGSTAGATACFAAAYRSLGRLEAWL